jgi:hypothetical protein
MAAKHQAFYDISCAENLYSQRTSCVDVDSLVARRYLEAAAAQKFPSQRATDDHRAMLDTQKAKRGESLEVDLAQDRVPKEHN